MDLSKELLDEFKEAYRLDFGVVLSDEETLEIAQRLIGLCMIICRPLPKGKEPDNENEDIEF